MSVWKCPEGFNPGQGLSSVRDRKTKTLFWVFLGVGVEEADRTSCVG